MFRSPRNCRLQYLGGQTPTHAVRSVFPFYSRRLPQHCSSRLERLLRLSPRLRLRRLCFLLACHHHAVMMADGLELVRVLGGGDTLDSCRRILYFFSDTSGGTRACSLYERRVASGRRRLRSGPDKWRKRLPRCSSWCLLESCCIVLSSGLLWSGRV